MNSHAILPLIALLGMQLTCRNPVISPADNSEERILFIRNTRDFSEICTMQPDGLDIQVIARYDYGDDYYWQGYRFAKWPSDKSRLVVEGGPGSNTEYNPLWLMDMEGELLQQLTWNGHQPLWTHDDETIIFARRRGYFSQTWDIYELNIATLEEDTLLWAETGLPGTGSGNIYGLLDILPNDNSRLLLSETYIYRDSSGRQIDDDSEILIYDIPGQQETYLTDNDNEEGRAKISPDGKFIVYTAKNQDVYPFSNNLYLMTVEGDSARQLTTGTTAVYLHTLWSPDGNYLVFFRSDQSDGPNSYGDLFTFNMHSNTMDTLLIRLEEEMSYKPVDWK